MCHGNGNFALHTIINVLPVHLFVFIIPRGSVDGVAIDLLTTCLLELWTDIWFDSRQTTT